MKSSAYIKIAVLCALLFTGSMYLSKVLALYTIRADIFTIDTSFYIQVALSLLIIMVATSLTIGAWQKYHQYIFIVGPIVLGTIFGVGNTLLLRTLPIILLMGAYLAYSIYMATKVYNNSIKIDPKIINRFLGRGTVLVFSVLAGFLFVYSNQKIDLGAQLQPIIQEPVSRVVQSQIQEFAPLGNVNLSAFIPQNLLESQLNIGSTVNNLIKPYQRYVLPALGVAIFALVQGLGIVAFLVFITLIDAIYWLAKKANFMHEEALQVEKHELRL